MAIKNWCKMLKAVRGHENEMTSVPATDVKEMIEEVEKLRSQAPTYVPHQMIGATHWAVCPDGKFLYYKLEDKLLLWFPLSKVWDNPGWLGDPSSVPYTLHCFADHRVIGIDPAAPGGDQTVAAAYKVCNHPDTISIMEAHPQSDRIFQCTRCGMKKTKDGDWLPDPPVSLG